MYEAAIKGLYEKYTTEDISKAYDDFLLIDYRTVSQARMVPMSSDVEKMRDELEDILETEILTRMNRWRVQAERFTLDVFDRLTTF
jgi:hypothetical protein